MHICDANVGRLKTLFIKESGLWAVEEIYTYIYTH